MWQNALPRLYDGAVKPPLVILSDLHLVHEGSSETAAAFAALLRATRGSEIVLAGDVFGLSSDPSKRDPVESMTALLGAYPEVGVSLREHLSGGFPVTFLAGNHDAALTVEGMRSALLNRLELTSSAPIQIEPWFIRRKGIHVEHGHLWDPDNAPAHPLARWSVATEPLGIQLTRHFVAKNQVWQFAHAHETTLLQGLLRAFQSFGERAPLLIARYFATSARICAETLFDRGLSRDRAEGERAVPRLAQASGVDAEAIRALLLQAPTPTHVDFRETFLRLYYDRVVSAAGMAGGAALLLGKWPGLGLGLILGGGAYWAFNVRRSGSRYQDQPVRRLREGARVVAHWTGAERVVFGHTHVPELEGCYANAGSFGYPQSGKGRPYLVLAADGSAEVRRQFS